MSNVGSAFSKEVRNSILKSGRDFNEENDCIPQKKFFPQFRDKKLKDENIYINTASWDKLYKKYERVPDFRKALNTFIFHKESHAEYQSRIPNLINDAVVQGEFWNIEIIGDPGSGKSVFFQGFLVPTHAIMSVRNFSVHCDIDGLDNCFNVDMVDILEAEMAKQKEVETQNIIDSFIVANKTTFRVEKPFDVYVSYNASQTTQIVQELFKSGDVAFQDESPVMHGKGSKTVRDNLENLLRTSARAMNLNFAFINPSFFPVETVHYYVKIMGYVRNRMITVATIMTHEEDHTDYIGCAEFQLHDIPGLKDYYKKVSLAKKKELKDSAGYSGRKPNKKQKEELIRVLVDAVGDDMEENDVGKATLGYVQSIANDIDKIRDNIDMKDIVAAAYRRILGGGSGDGDSDDDGGSPAPAKPNRDAVPEPASTRPTFKSHDEVISNEMAQIVKRSVATGTMSNDDSARMKFLKQGLNLTNEEIVDLETNAITIATARTMSSERNQAMIDAANLTPAVQPASPPTSDFSVTKAMIKEKANALKPNFKEPKQVDYYLASLEKSMVDVAVEFGLTEGAISQAWTRVNTLVQQQIGREYEGWYADYLDRHKEDLKIENVYHDGASSQPDIVVKYLDQSYDVISVKWRNPHRGKPSFTINQNELNPEIIKARTLVKDGKKARMLMHLRIMEHTKKVEEIINFVEPKKTYSYSIKDFE